jgi:hypothetical protein
MRIRFSLVLSLLAACTSSSTTPNAGPAVGGGGGSAGSPGSPATGVTGNNGGNTMNGGSATGANDAGASDGGASDPGPASVDGAAPADLAMTATPPPPPPPPPPPSFPWVTDYSSHPPSAVTLPSRLGAYVDPDFGSKIIRVTDASDGTHCVNAYAYWPAFNTDSTRLMISCDSTIQLYRFDPSSDTLTYDQPLVPGGVPQYLQFEGAFWSHDQPTILYAIAGYKLYRVDVSQSGAGRFTVVRDFTGTLGYTFWPFQLGKSDDDNVFTWSSRGDQFGSTGGIDVVVYKRDTDQVFVFPRPSGFSVDESQMSKDGQRVIIPSSNSVGWAIWTWSTGQVDILASNPTARPGGHYDGGRTKLVNADNWNTGFQSRDWASPGSQAPHDFFTTFDSDGRTLDWAVPDHVSMRSDDESFVIMSTYGSTAGWQPFMREIVLLRTDGSGFARLGHTLGTASDYFSEPRAVVDRGGRYVVYTSDLGSATRLDVMLLKIPQPFASTLP